MAENRSCGTMPSGQQTKENVCIDCGRVLDSCKDKDCFSDTRVWLTGYGQDIIERTGSVRIKDAQTVGAQVSLEPVPFNRGFFDVYVRYFVKLTAEACVGGGRAQEFCGIAVCDKKCVLYGGEGSVSIFRSGQSGTGSGCTVLPDTGTGNLPEAVVETVDPVVLSAKVEDSCDCDCGCNNCGCGGNNNARSGCGSSCGCGCTCPEQIPDNVLAFADGALVSDCNKNLLVTLGFFSVIRIERPGQFLVSAAEYSVPDKVCPCSGDDDPCTVFDRMAFPVSEFTGVPKC